MNIKSFGFRASHLLFDHLISYLFLEIVWFSNIRSGLKTMNIKYGLEVEDNEEVGDDEL